MDLMEITVGQYLKKTADKFPDGMAIINFKGKCGMTWRELDTGSNQLAKSLLALGVKKGDHVAIWATNRAEWVLCFLGASKIGAVAVTVNVNYQLAEIQKLLENADVNTLVFMDGFRSIDYIEIVRQLWGDIKNTHSEKVPTLKHLIHFGERKCPGAMELDELLSLGNEITDEQLAQCEAQVNCHDTVSLQFTSGSTGEQKGVMLSHFNLINNSYFSGMGLHLSEKDRLCLSVPFFHCFGLSAGILMCIGQATTMVLVECYRAIEVMQAVSSLKCTVLHGVPTMFLKIMEHPDFDKYNYSTLRTGIIAGASCSEKIVRGVVEKMGIKEIAVAYGQTESSPCCTQTPYGSSIEKKISTIGKPIDFVEMKAVNPETGETCAVNETGELCTRGFHVMKGYYHHPELTQKAIDADGWLHTGDIGFLDDKGYYHFSGRIKDIIVRGGENISPQEIEAALLQHDAVLDAKVYGVPVEVYGEEVAATIRLRSGSNMSPDEVRGFLSNRIAHYKIPKYIEFCERYPLTPSGKIKTCLLREQMIKKMKNPLSFLSGSVH